MLDDGIRKNVVYRMEGKYLEIVFVFHIPKKWRISKERTLKKTA
jgi:hypothetical protein